MKAVLLIGWLVALLAAVPVCADCQYPQGPPPEVPDPNVATERQMMEARLKVEKYVAQAEGFARCASHSSDKRAVRTLKKAARIAEKYNRAHQLYSRRQQTHR